jgi:hypothetical protein
MNYCLEAEKGLAAVTEQRDDLQMQLDSSCNAEELRQFRAERDEAREYADKLAEGLPDGMLPKDVEVLREANLGLATELAAVTEQRDQFESKLCIALRGHPDSVLWGDAGLIAATMRCVDALGEVTDQRDRLAEALLKLRNNESFSLGGAAYEIIEQALQSLTPNAESIHPESKPNDHE